MQIIWINFDSVLPFWIEKWVLESFWKALSILQKEFCVIELETDALPKNLKEFSIYGYGFVVSFLLNEPIFNLRCHC